MPSFSAKFIIAFAALYFTSNREATVDTEIVFAILSGRVASQKSNSSTKDLSKISIIFKNCL